MYDPAEDWDMPYTDDLPTVCVQHLRFIPCRPGMRTNDCQLSTHPDAVMAVRRHQEL